MYAPTSPLCTGPVKPMDKAAAIKAKTLRRFSTRLILQYFEKSLLRGKVYGMDRRLKPPVACRIGSRSAANSSRHDGIHRQNPQR
jgi:hypothetical protein